MTSNNLLPASVLTRKAVVYVRQSTPGQVQNNLESRRRQYELVDVARRWGFRDVDVIDDDLGRTASGAIDRTGFERLVSGLCTGKSARFNHISGHGGQCGSRTPVTTSV